MGTHIGSAGPTAVVHLDLLRTHYLCAAAGGSQNIQTLIVLRFFAGAFGSSPLTNAGGTISDIFNAEHRGLAMAVFASCPFLGARGGALVTQKLLDLAYYRTSCRWVCIRVHRMAMGGRLDGHTLWKSSNFWHPSPTPDLRPCSPPSARSQVGKSNW